MENDEEEDSDVDYEPTVFSNNPTERIAARRLRIERRVEALRKRQEQLESQKEDTGVDAEAVKATAIELQVEKSIELLEKLILEGDEYVSNVRVATEAREADRRERDGIAKEKLLKELEDEAEAAAGMFHEIADKWIGILKYNDPLHINEDITSQKERCDELIKQKDGIIATLKEKLKKAEIEFAVDQRKQIEDVNSIAQRIEKQIVIMRKAYRQELQMIEDVVLAERQLLIEASNKKWEELYKKRDQEEKNNADLRSEDYWQFVEDTDNLNRDFQELYRATTIKLENDCDELQRELEKIKTDAIMNSEKLDYNYQILKKREDENLIIRSQQKRRINKLQDTINELRKKNNDYYTSTMKEIERLTAEIKKLTKNILDVEKKADHMAEVNNNKFKKIWNMNKKRADELFNRILDIDKVLHEQQLGLIWSPPKYQLPDELEMMPQSQRQLVKESGTSGKRTLMSNSQMAFEMCTYDNEDNASYMKVTRHILNLIANKIGFLIEDKLYAILEPYLEHERTLVKVDNVFEALKIKEKDDIKLLVDFFIPYMFCPICNVSAEKAGGVDEESVLHVQEIDPITLRDLASGESKAKPDESSLINAVQEITGKDDSGTVIEFGPLSVTLYDDHLKDECRGPEAAPRAMTTDESKTLEEVFEEAPCHFSHPVMISSVYVLKALKEFLTKYHIPKESMPTMNQRLAFTRSTFSRLIASEDIVSYWNRYTELFPKEREQLWDSLLQAMKKYHELLKDRKNVSEEVMCLRKQNFDLRRLFANYIEKKDIPY